MSTVNQSKNWCLKKLNQVKISDSVTKIEQNSSSKKAQLSKVIKKVQAQLQQYKTNLIKILNINSHKHN